MTILTSEFDLKKLRSLNREELLGLAQEVREIIIQTVSTNGGHLASSLGVVEISLALHYAFNTPEDKIIWDVGHQCYPHKLLTGRLDRFHTLRKIGGISGFPKSSESVFDCFDTGHSGTSISAALGMAIQRDLAEQSHKVIAIIGDGSLTNGMALEAMNHAGFMGTDLIVILNDNEKSISRNVGAYSRYLSRLRMELMYAHSKDKMKKILHHPIVGRRPSGDPLTQLRERIKNILTPSRTGAVFQELGFAYLGPIDGHDILLLCEVFESVKQLGGPVLIHAVTSKGKGYKFAEEDSTKFHGIGSFDRTNGRAEGLSAKPSYTAVFGNTLSELAQDDTRIVAITAAMQDGTGLTNFRNRFPTRFFDVGIAEEHAVTLAAGLAKSGAKPFVAIYSTFLQRAYDQILHDVCLQKLPVRFMLDRGGIVGEDGPTHHGVFDLSYLRTMPNMVIMSPKDGDELRDMVATAAGYDNGPVALRYPRGNIPATIRDGVPTPIGIPSWDTVIHGQEIAVLAVGSAVCAAEMAADILRVEGLNITVVNSRFVKPLDYGLLKDIADNHKYLVTVEENSLVGGFGSAVLEYLCDCYGPGLKVKRIGLPDLFLEHGPQEVLREMYGLTSLKIARTIQDLVSSTNK